MPIIGIIGSMGSGKTLTLTHALYNDFLNKREIYTNYKTTFGKYLDKTFFENYIKSEQQIKNCSLGIDEIHLFFDSRSSGSRKNRIFSYFALQTRKRSVDLYYTAQFLNSVELRIRLHTDIYMYPKYDKDNEIVTVTVLVKREDYNSIYYKKRLFRFDARGIFDKFDTNEIINILDSDITDKKKKD